MSLYIYFGGKPNVPVVKWKDRLLFSVYVQYNCIF